MDYTGCMIWLGSLKGTGTYESFVHESWYLFDSLITD